MIPIAKTVLVVDDESLIRAVLHERLVRAGFLVHEAESGWDAASRLGIEDMGRGIDAVLLDYVLPGGGFAFIEWVRATHPRSRVILMTASATPDLVENARTRNVLTVIGKPFDADDVARLVSLELAR